MKAFQGWCEVEGYGPRTGMFCCKIACLPEQSVISLHTQECELAHCLQGSDLTGLGGCFACSLFSVFIPHLCALPVTTSPWVHSSYTFLQSPEQFIYGIQGSVATHFCLSVSHHQIVLILIILFN